MIEKRAVVARTPDSRMREVRPLVVSLMKCTQWTARV